MLTDAQKTDIRRHCGYPAYGATPAGFNSWRFYQVYGLLEYRMNNLSAAETNVIVTYLAQLSALEFAVPKASEGMDTDQASVWTRNRSEAKDRAGLFDDWRRRLCGFLGVPPGPALGERGITWIV